MGIRALETSPSRSYSRCLRPEKKSRDQPSLAKLVKNNEATLKLLMGSLAARRDTELDGWGRFMDGRIRMPCPQTIGGRPWGGRFDRCWIPTWFLCYRCWSQHYCLVYPVEVRSTVGPPCYGDHQMNSLFSTGLRRGPIFGRGL